MSDISVGKPRITRKNTLLPTKKFCPKCLSELSRGSKLGGWLVTQDYYCEKCGYHGVLFLEKDEGDTKPEEEGGRSNP
ncbi:MAG TPA: hypothetical protein VEJ36_08995 [Nitrososphaerales archaeon]|nr:hypothetical protein [Nitrososphaerales archaeon]